MYDFKRDDPDRRSVVSEPVRDAEHGAPAPRKDYNALQEINAELLEALEHARLFIRNGVELGYVKMPDADTPDPAHETLPKIEAAIAKARSQS